MRDSNPQHSVLETDALPIELIASNRWKCYYKDFLEKCKYFHKSLANLLSFFTKTIPMLPWSLVLGQR